MAGTRRALGTISSAIASMVSTPERDQVGLVALEPAHLGQGHVAGGGDDEHDGQERVAPALAPRRRAPHRRRPRPWPPSSGSVVSRLRIDTRLNWLLGSPLTPWPLASTEFGSHPWPMSLVEHGEADERHDRGHPHERRPDGAARRSRGPSPVRQPGRHRASMRHRRCAAGEEQRLEPGEGGQAQQHVRQPPRPAGRLPRDAARNSTTALSTSATWSVCSMPSRVSAGRKSTNTTSTTTASASSGRRRLGRSTRCWPATMRMTHSPATRLISNGPTLSASGIPIDRRPLATRR